MNMKAVMGSGVSSGVSGGFGSPEAVDLVSMEKSNRSHAFNDDTFINPHVTANE